MMAMVDSVTGMVYWVPAEYQAPIPPPYTPVVMPYRYLRPVAPAMAALMGPAVNTTVFVRGVPRESTTQTVEAHFKVFGDISSCHVIRHKDASTNKGIAFVKFHDPAGALLAIRCNSPGVLDQREIFAEWAHPKPATSAARALPDQHPAAAEYFPRPGLFLAAPANHLITRPSFFPAPTPAMPALAFNAHLPWPLPASPSAAPYRPHGAHVVGFPHPGFTYAHDSPPAASSPSFYPAADYSYPPAGAPSGSGVPSGSRVPSDGAQPDAENSDEDTATPIGVEESSPPESSQRKAKAKEKAEEKESPNSS